MKLCFGSLTRALVIVPHQDDDIMFAGITISLMRRKGIEVFVLFSTNGDWRYSAEKRLHEARKALNTITNIDDEHILILGYSDNYIDNNHSHYFYINEGSVEYKNGRNRTYGIDGKDEYCYMKWGIHHDFCRSNFEKDLAGQIIDIKPELIICVDFDEHPDHKMLSISFDRAMGIILSNDNKYRPIVLKGFAYSCYYNATRNLLKKEDNSTQMPLKGLTQNYHYDMIGTSIFQWEKRIQVFGTKREITRNLFLNTKSKALSKHWSQFVALRADRIINDDEVFWHRRTDSLSYKAKVISTSGNAGCLNDFCLYSLSDIDATKPIFNEYLWKPNDERKSATFIWSHEQEICCIRIYGSISHNSKINQVKLSFDNGFEVLAGPLDSKGKACEIIFDKQVNVTQCTLTILGCYGDDYGISECEFYSEIPDDFQGVSNEELHSKFNFFDVVAGSLYLDFFKCLKFTRKVYRYIIKKLYIWA